MHVKLLLQNVIMQIMHQSLMIETHEANPMIRVTFNIHCRKKLHIYTVPQHNIEALK